MNQRYFIVKGLVAACAVLLAIGIVFLREGVAQGTLALSNDFSCAATLLTDDS